MLLDMHLILLFIGEHHRRRERKMRESVNILGTQYAIKFGNESEYPNLADNDGYIDTSVKEIIIDDMTASENDIARKKNIEAYKKQVLRHEIIHAFLAESGLDGNGSFSGHWECNEEMVDWFAIQSPKIFKVFIEVGMIDLKNLLPVCNAETMSDGITTFVVEAMTDVGV